MIAAQSSRAVAAGTRRNRDTAQSSCMQVATPALTQASRGECGEVSFRIHTLPPRRPDFPFWERKSKLQHDRDRGTVNGLMYGDGPRRTDDATRHFVHGHHEELGRDATGERQYRATQQQRNARRARGGRAARVSARLTLGAAAARWGSGGCALFLLSEPAGVFHTSHRFHGSDGVARFPRLAHTAFYNA